MGKINLKIKNAIDHLINCGTASGLDAACRMLCTCTEREPEELSQHQFSGICLSILASGGPYDKETIC